MYRLKSLFNVGKNIARKKKERERDRLDTFVTRVCPYITSKKDFIIFLSNILYIFGYLHPLVSGSYLQN